MGRFPFGAKRDERQYTISGAQDRSGVPPIEPNAAPGPQARGPAGLC